MKGQLPLKWKKILSFKDENPSGRPLANRPQGIFKPQGLLAALSIKSKPPEKRLDRRPAGGMSLTCCRAR